ncbi:winged helix-turn-helix transcriptional regulator [Kitasatospora sp. NPDC018058]|uniref:winged helix-turn-helix transcriptional regulator n=1 Tax=Kitasatospora sp. NPDC018058 TaxID=3364025 RepID=UPI0037C10B99
MALATLPTPEPLAADADLAAAFDVLGQKWNGIILHTLVTRPARFGELRTAIEHISTKMLADTIPGAQLVEIPTGHLPMVERPEEWQKLITDFLTKHNA